MKWWMREDWSERLMIGVGCFLTLLGVGELIFGSGVERWIFLPMAIVILALSIVIFKRRQTRDRSKEQEPTDR